MERVSESSNHVQERVDIMLTAADRELTGAESYLNYLRGSDVAGMLTFCGQRERVEVLRIVRQVLLGLKGNSDKLNIDYVSSVVMEGKKRITLDLNSSNLDES